MRTAVARRSGGPSDPTIPPPKVYMPSSLLLGAKPDQTTNHHIAKNNFNPATSAAIQMEYNYYHYYCTTTSSPCSQSLCPSQPLCPPLLLLYVRIKEWHEVPSHAFSNPPTHQRLDATPLGPCHPNETPGGVFPCPQRSLKSQRIHKFIQPQLRS